MSELFRIHKLALHPVKVGSILLGLVLSFLAVELAGWSAGLLPDGGHPLVRYFAVTEALLQHGRFDLLAGVFAWMCFVWATLGGAATRRMSLDVLGGAREGLIESFLYCLKWPLAVPSALAALCFFYILLARLYPWLLLLLLPTWLYAGLLYGALTLEEVGLRTAFRKVHGRAGAWRRGLRLQARYLVSFAVSTGAIYLLAGLYSAGVLLAFRRPGGGLNSLQLALIVPVAAYALGYTTSNLKSLQVYLYLKLYLEE